MPERATTATVVTTRDVGSRHAESAPGLDHATVRTIGRLQVGQVKAPDSFPDLVDVSQAFRNVNQLPRTDIPLRGIDWKDATNLCDKARHRQYGGQDELSHGSLQ